MTPRGDTELSLFGCRPRDTCCPTGIQDLQELIETTRRKYGRVATRAAKLHAHCGYERLAVLQKTN